MARQREPNRDANRINAVTRAFDIVDALRERRSAGVSELAEQLDVPKSTAHVYLQTLEDEGYLVNRGGTYALSYRFLEVGGALRHDLSLFHAARQELDALSADTGEVVNLGIEERGRRVLLYTSEPSQGMFDNSPTGQYTRMHWTALGKALLAQLPDDRVNDVIDRLGLPPATENTITDRDALHAELETIRDQGYSVEREERREGITAVAVPLHHDDDDEPVSAVSISGPKRRIGDDSIDEDLLKALRDVVNVVELQYKHY